MPEEEAVEVSKPEPKVEEVVEKVPGPEVEPWPPLPPTEEEEKEAWPPLPPGSPPKKKEEVGNESKFHFGWQEEDAFMDDYAQSLAFNRSSGKARVFFLS